MMLGALFEVVAECHAHPHYNEKYLGALLEGRRAAAHV